MLRPKPRLGNAKLPWLLGANSSFNYSNHSSSRKY
jgi:hypothetical protein